MSLPTVPKTNSRDEAVNLILTSIAMEEVALSHILNAEGEKIQYALGTLENKPSNPATVEDVLKVNASVQGTLEASGKNQAVLAEKMKAALNASTMQGPTGPQGPKGDPSIEMNAIDEETYTLLPIDVQRDPGILWIIYPQNINLVV